MTYIIETNKDPNRLAKEVTFKLSLGWQLVGGVSIATSISNAGTHYMYYCQALQSDIL